MIESRFLYTSMLSDDDASSVHVLTQMGLVQIWHGRHPFLRCEGTLLATRRGGIMVFQSSPDAHPSLTNRRGSQDERWFHLAITSTEEGVQALAGAEGIEISTPFDGPIGSAVMADVQLPGGDTIEVELCIAAGAAVAAPSSQFVRVESTAMVAYSTAEVAAALEPLDLVADPGHDAFFPTLGGTNRIVMMGDHYLEYAGADDGGPMAGLHKRLGRQGIFGVNLEPLDMDEFVARAHRDGLKMNTDVPAVLPVEVGGKAMACANIITVNPRATGGARIFVLTPLEYPWNLVR